MSTIILTRNISKIIKQSAYPARWLFYWTTFKVRDGWKWKILPKYRREKGIYRGYSGGTIWSVEEWEEKFGKEYYISEDLEFYYHPYCIIVPNGGNNNTVYFKTDEELNIYVDSIIKDNPHIIV